MKPNIKLGLTVLVAALALASGASAGSLVGKVICKGLRSSANAIVYVDVIPGRTYEAPEAHALVDQKNMVFEPHVLPVIEGTSVDFLNSDPVLHNVFSPDKCAQKFNLGSWPQDEKRSFTFEERCVSTILCRVHPEMEAYILVVPTPFYAVTAEDGTFFIADVPDTVLTVKAWHPKLKEQDLEVLVAGDSVSVEFVLKR